MNYDISIILATKNRGKLLEEMLGSLQKAAEKIKYEIIVIDGDSSDNTLEVLKKYKVEKIFSEGEALGPGRHSWPQLYNFGFKYASGKWGMYASDDILFEEKSFDRAIDFLEKCDSNVAGGAFFYKNIKADNDWKDYGVDFTYGQQILINYGLIRMDLFKKVGGLDERYKFYCADGDICLTLINAGFKIYPIPYASLIHNNVLDEAKKINNQNAEADIELYKAKWEKNYGSAMPNPRRIGEKEFLKYFEVGLNTIYDSKNLKSLVANKKVIKLHLGCGQNYFPGYINIDYPPSEHEVMNVRADIYSDIIKLEFPDLSIDEIRLHHVFEHFNRVTALALLIRWQKWLKPGGILRIETPDIEGCAKILSSDAPLKRKMAIIRHLAGDQASQWAFHIDHWFAERFHSTLNKMGFNIINTNSYIQQTSPFLPNVEVIASKQKIMSHEELINVCDELLADSTVSELEDKTLSVWKEQLRRFLRGEEIYKNTEKIDESKISDKDVTIQLPNLINVPNISEVYNFNQNERDNWVVSKAKEILPGSIVLDVGAGTCPYRNYFNHCKYIAHDFKKYKGEKLGSTTEYGEIDIESDITSIPLDSNSVDVILCTEVLEHVPEPVEALKEMTRILKPEGKLLITAPLGSGLHQLPYHYYGGYTPEWYNYFGEKFSLELVEIIPNGGFFKLLAQETSRAFWTLSEHQHLHGEFLNSFKFLFGEWLPKYLFALEGNCMIDQFTVGYHVEYKKIKNDLNIKTKPNKQHNTIDENCREDDNLNSTPILPNAKATAIIFSKDRAMQLDATLNSFFYHCKDYQDLNLKVLYTYSDETYKNGYDTLKRIFPTVDFIKEANFRDDLLTCIDNNDYIILLVDDNIFVKGFYSKDATKFLKNNSEAIAFSLRLGKNTTYCYPLDKQQTLPPFVSCGLEISKYYWENSDYDFSYPMEVSSSMYRADFIKTIISQINFKNPNELESKLNSLKLNFRDSFPVMGCFNQSVTFCAPLNKVQIIENNRSGGKSNYSTRELSRLFNNHYRIDIKQLDNYIPKGCHQEIDLPFKRVDEINRKKSSELISVIIPCYNQAKYLSDAVDSIIKQSYNNYEVIIVNDGSTDDTSEVAQNLMDKYKHVKIRVVEKQNGGLSSARNTGIANANGEYFIPLDADDKLHPQFMEKTLSIINIDQKYGFVYSNIQHFGDLNNIYNQPQFDSYTLVNHDNIVSVTSLVRKQVWVDNNGYNENMKEGYEDWDFWIGAVENGWMGYRINESLFFYRKKSNSMLVNSNMKREKLIARIIMNHPKLYHKNQIKIANSVLQGEENVNKKKILIACTHFWPSSGGVESIAEDLGFNLAGLGYKVDVATIGRNDRPSNKYRGMNIISLDSTGAVQDNIPKWAVELRRLVLTGEYSCCILLADPLNHIIWSLFNAEIPSQTRLIIQPIINKDGYEKWRNDLDFRKNLSSILKKASVISMSMDGLDVQFFKEESLPFSYIPNASSRGNSDSDFRIKHNIPEDAVFILHVANLWPVKNHLAIIEEFKDMPVNWVLVMIGYPSGDLQYVNKVKSKIENNKNVVYIPGLPKDEISSAMESSDFIILASKAEGAPVTILEAMAHGKPWLATPRCGSVSENAGGLITELEKFKTAIKFLLSNAELRNELGNLGKEHWENTFNWEIVIKAWEELILKGKTALTFEMNKEISEGMNRINSEWNNYSADNTTNSGNDDQPLVSIIIPTFNRPDKLKKAVGSVLSQLYKNFEIIVVNDAGEDVSGIIHEFNDSKIKLVNHEVNKGLAAARNTGISEAAGLYIALLDDDDEFYPTHLLTAVRELENGVDVVYTDAVRHSYLKEEDIYVLNSKTVPYSIEFDRNKLLIGNIAPVNCFVFKKSLLDTSGLFDESLPVLEDWEFWIRLSAVSEFKHIKENTVQVNWYNDGSTMSSSKGRDFVITRKKIYEKYEPEIKNIKNINEILDEFNSIWKSDNLVDTPVVSIISLTFNQLEYTKAFVDSVIRYTKLPFELILVDNASEMETVSYLKRLAREEKRVKIIFNDENKGFPRGVNQGIKNAAGKYLLIANNDIVVTEGWLERMLEVAESDYQIGLVGPVSNIVSGVQLDREAKYGSIEEMHVYAKGIKRENAGKTFKFPRIAFLCTLIKRGVINKLGGLDERFSPGNFEDDDYCLRAQIAGYKTVIARDVFIHHFGSKSFTAEGTEKYAERLETNKKIFVDKWGADPEEIWLKGNKYLPKSFFYPLGNDELSEAVHRAQVCLKDKEYALALGYLEFVFESDSSLLMKNNLKMESLYHLAGKICLLELKYEAALNYFRRELDYNEGSVRAFRGMGEAFKGLGANEEAFEMYQKSKVPQTTSSEA